MIRLYKNTIVLAIILLSFENFAQIKSIGIPNIINYSRQDYNASTQNWAATQDKRGVLYFGNNNGILEFDGINWRIIPVPNISVVRSITVDNKGTVYVGAYNEFGYLKAGKNGVLNFVSLTDLVPNDLRNFGDIWKIYETDKGIIFQSFSEIFLLTNNQIKVIAQKRDFHFSFYINNVLYITERNKGLLKLVDEKLIPVSGGGIFNNNIWTMLPFSDSKILIGTANMGLYILEDETVKVWNIEASDFLKQNQVYCGTKVKGYFALGTIQNGLLIIDENGMPIQHINREKGLQNNTILSLYADNYDNLWVGLDNGIDYVGTNSPFTNIVNESKIGAGYASCLFQGKLYLGTNQGLFYKDWKELNNPLRENVDFKLVKNSQGQVWSLFVYENTLFCGHNHGTYIINNDKAELISDEMGGWTEFEIPDQKNMFLQGTYTGINKYNKLKGKWVSEKMPGFNESCRVIESYLGKQDYTLWISHGYKGVYKLELNKELDSIISISFYNEDNGLGSSLGNTVLRFYDDIVVANETGIYKFNETTNSFEIEQDLVELFGMKNGELKRVFKDKSNNLWFVQGDEMGMIKKLNDGSYKVNRTVYKSFWGNFVGSFEHLNPYNNKNVLIATGEGFSHFQSDFIKDTEIPFNVLIRSVKTINDSVLFGGTFINENENVSNIQMSSQINELTYNLNSLRIDYSVTNYENIKSVKYQYYLEGYDDEWSDWVKEHSKEYTNLKEGMYTFHVKAKNIFNVESDEVSYKFIIAPPWYRSTIAIVVYILLSLLTVYIIAKAIKSNVDKEKRLIYLKQKKELHQQKISHDNEVLSAQQEIVKLRNEKLRIENERNRAEVELKTKELAGYAMQITQKNETLYSMKEQLKHISQKVNPDAQKYLQKLIRKIEQSTNQKEDWEKFEGYFDQVYEDFTKRLRERYPQLTPNDIKLCAYLRMNLSTKEIAPLLNISIRGVEVSRYRLRKKLNMPQNENLIDFMMNL